MNTIYTHHWEKRRMEVIEGDAEVNTKSGRFTTVEIRISQPTVWPDEKRMKVMVTYDITEGWANYTHLQMVEEIVMPMPNNWSNVQVIGAADFYLHTVIHGKNHRWNPINTNSVNWIQRIYAKIDGPGDDNEGNAGLIINFAIPVEYSRQ